MTDYPWYKRDARAFYEGTRRLTLEQRGAYSDVIDLMFIHGGPIPDDAKWMSHALHVSTRKWRALREVLIEAGKIEIEDGQITNARAQLELDSRAVRARTNRETALNRWRTESEKSEKPNENNETPMQDASRARKSKIEEEEKERISPLTPQGGTDDPFGLLDPFLTAGCERQADGTFALVNGKRQEWLDEFRGDEQAFRMAMKEANGCFQPSRAKTPLQQIERTLGRIVRETADRDRRYQSATQAKSASEDQRTTKAKAALAAIMEGKA